MKKQIQFNKGGSSMNKKKILVISLAVCLVAILSMGTLAWFTADDSVTNNFYVAGSEDQNPNDVFSVDVWEDKDLIDNGEDKIQDGIKYPAILPGDDLYKEVNVENTGAYDQYVRAIVTVSDAHIWQQLHGTVYVSLDKIATDLNGKFKTWSIEYNADKDELTYVLYFDEILPAEGQDIVTLFTNIAIPEVMNRYQAAEMAGGFVINVVAEAVQTKHVGDNAAKAFETVGMAIEAGNSTIMTTAAGVKNVLASGAVSAVTLPAELVGQTVEINDDIANVTIDAAQQNIGLKFTGKLDNVVVTGVKDNGDATPALTITSAASGDLTIKDSYFFDDNSQPFGGIAGNGTATNLSLTVDGCTMEGARPLYLTNMHNLTVTNTTFKGVTGGSWAIMMNGTVTGNIVVDGCTFEGCTGILKAGVAGSQDWQTGTTGDVTFINNVLNNNNPKNGTFFATNSVGTVTESGNTGNTTEIAGWTNGLN